MTYDRLHDNLHLCCLDQRQHEQTCGYWYTVTGYGFTPHTAFRTKAALLAWLDSHGIKLTAEIPAERGTHAYQPLEGAYIERGHMSVETMPTRGRRILKMSNAEYTAAVVTHESGHAVVNYVNPNGARPAFDYALARAHEDAGLPGLPSAMLTERPVHTNKGIAAVPG